MFVITSLNNIFDIKYSNNPKVVIIPVPWEGTVSYGTGTSKAPEAIRQASFQIDLCDYDFGSLENLGINYLEADIRIAELNLKANRKNLNELSKKLDTLVFELCQKQKSFVILLGGEHSISLGGFKNTFLKTKGEYSVLQLDAHMDLRKAYQGYIGSHASVFYNLMTSDFAPSSLVQVGIRDFEVNELEFSKGNNIYTFFDRQIKMDLHRNISWLAICDQFIEKLAKNVHISIDIDVLNPQYCTGTGTPVPGGLDFDQVVTLVKLISEKRKIVGADLVEVAPLGGDNNLNANVGMRLLYKLIGFSAKSNGMI